MSETMIDYSGIGLATSSSFIKKGLYFIEILILKKKKKIQITPLINPIYSLNDEKTDDWEGCLSIPECRD